MSTIDNQNQVPSVNQSDLIPVYSNIFGVTQNMSVSQLVSYILSLIGANNLATQYFAPNDTSFSMTIDSLPNVWLLLTPTNDFASGTIVMPDLPNDGDTVAITCTRNVTAITISGNGNLVNGAPNGLQANTTIGFRYNQINSSWYATSFVDLGGVAWGEITGTLSNQTDLQNALNAKQNTLVSGTSIRTVNGNSLLGSGNIVISSSTNWGSIGGTLADQTDLQNALNLKVNASALATVATTGAYADLSGRPTLGTAAAANVGDFATAAQGAKADSAAQLDVTQGYTASQYSVVRDVAYSATVTLDLTLRDNVRIGTLTGNLTLANPSAMNVGQSGAIILTQDATGSRLISYGSQWVAEGGAQALSTTPNAIDVLYYFVVSASRIDYRLRKAV